MRYNLTTTTTTVRVATCESVQVIRQALCSASSAIWGDAAEGGGGNDIQ